MPRHAVASAVEGDHRILTAAVVAEYAACDGRDRRDARTPERPRRAPEASAAMALVTAATEPQHRFVAFTKGSYPSMWSATHGSA